MRTLRRTILIPYLMTLGMSFASAQSAPKPGLWEMTTTLDMIRRQSPQSAFAETVPSASAPTVNGATVVNESPVQIRTFKQRVCMSHEAIEKYGVPFFGEVGRCSLANVRLTDNGMTADLSCNGREVGKGTIATSWADAEHAKGSTELSIIGVVGQASSLEKKAQFTAVYKGSDCGKARPFQP